MRERSVRLQESGTDGVLETVKEASGDLQISTNFMKEINRLLIIRDDKLGDNCLSLPVLEALLDVSPHTRVTWACQPQWADLVTDHPLVEEVWAIPGKPSISEQIKLSRRIRNHKPDAMLLLRYSREWDRVIRYSGVPIRAGMKYRASSKALTKNGWDMLDRRYHEARRSLDVLSVALGIELGNYPARIHTTPEKAAASIAKLARMGVPDEYYVIQLGMGGTSLAMPPSFMAEVANKVTAQTGLIPVLTGVEAEAKFESEFVQRLKGRYVSVIGKTSVADLSALVQQANLILSVDTGIVHFGAALNVPSVVVMPKLQHSPEKWHPWMVPHRIIRPAEFCAGCTFKSCKSGQGRCLEAVSVDETFDACMQLICEGSRQRAVVSIAGVAGGSV